MKTYFIGYGYRETTSWSCPDCNNYHTGGMDLSVYENVRKHKQECPAAGDFTQVFRDGRWIYVRNRPQIIPAISADEIDAALCSWCRDGWEKRLVSGITLHFNGGCLGSCTAVGLLRENVERLIRKAEKL